MLHLLYPNYFHSNEMGILCQFDVVRCERNNNVWWHVLHFVLTIFYFDVLFFFCFSCIGR